MSLQPALGKVNFCNEARRMLRETLAESEKRSTYLSPICWTSNRRQINSEARCWRASILSQVSEARPNSTNHKSRLETGRNESSRVLDQSIIRRSSSKMDQVAPECKRSPPSGYKGDDHHTCQSRKPALRAASSVPRSLTLRRSLDSVFFVVAFASTYFTVVSAQAVANFSVGVGTSNNYSFNTLLLNSAHIYQKDSSSDNINIQDGSLALIRSAGDVGIAYYKQPVKLLDLPSKQSASFRTSFTINNRPQLNAPSEHVGDGMTFLMAANNSFYGGSGGWLGVFDSMTFSTPFKSIVVEFDVYQNDGPEYDINDNHVSFDFKNITAATSANATAEAIFLWDNNTKYGWVEYDRDTFQLELRVSYTVSKPVQPLLSYTMNLTDFVEEEMWVGFSGSSGTSYSNFYIGNWTFESWGIPAPPPAPSPTSPVPSSLDPTVSSSGPTGQKSDGDKLGLIVGISVGVVFLLICVTVIAFFARRKTWSGGIRQLGGPAITEEDLAFQLEGMPERFSYKQLSVATRGFSKETKLGQGGFGSVHRGLLPSSGIAVAVKKINSDSNQGEKEFMAEVSIISRLRHRNLIQLQGWCKDASRGKYLLVYELMPNGSLDKALFQAPESQKPCLSWAQRFNIVAGTAAAVDYLHQGWKQQVIHRDIKSSNIMLDEEWNAKLGDFGLARLVDHAREAATTMVAGTYGFIAPEAATTGRFTDKTDVFAFGAVVLEIACGRSAFSGKLPSEEMFLVDWVWQRLSEGALLTSVDKRLADYDTYSMEVVLILGLLCSHPNPVARPSMRQVVQVLAGEAPVPSIPASKPTPFNSDIDPEVLSIDFLLNSKSGSCSKSRSGSMSLVDLSNSISSRRSTVKSSNGTSFFESLTS